MNRVVAIVLLAAVVCAVPAVRAEDKAADLTDLAALRTAVRTDKKALVASTLALTEAEGKKFWPIYDAYQRNLDLTNRQRSVAVEGLIARDKPMSDLYAKKIATDLLAADETEIKARRTAHNKVLKALPAIKAARYLQLESKIRAAQAYDLAVGIPLLK